MGKVHYSADAALQHTVASPPRQLEASLGLKDSAADQNVRPQRQDEGRLGVDNTIGGVQDFVVNPAATRLRRCKAFGNDMAPVKSHPHPLPAAKAVGFGVISLSVQRAWLGA